MKIQESDFEDWVCDNIGEVVEGCGVGLLGRQVNCPDGNIIDVLASRWCPKCDYPHRELVVIELKKNKATSDGFIQLLRYVGHFRGAQWMVDEGAGYCCVAGILAAPRLSPRMEIVIQAVQPDIRFCRLGVDITATQTFWHRTPGEHSDQVVERLSAAALGSPPADAWSEASRGTLGVPNATIPEPSEVTFSVRQEGLVVLAKYERPHHEVVSDAVHSWSSESVEFRKRLASILNLEDEYSLTIYVEASTPAGLLTGN